MPGRAQGEGIQTAGDGIGEPGTVEGSGSTGSPLAHGSMLAIGLATTMEATGTIEGAGTMDASGAGDISPGATLMDGVVGHADDGATDMAGGEAPGSPDASCARTSAGPHISAVTMTIDPANE